MTGEKWHRRKTAMTHELTFNELVIESQYLLKLQSAKFQKYPVGPSCHSLCVAAPAIKPTYPAGLGLGGSQPMKKPILVSLVLFNYSLKALMLEASTTRWSS